MTRSLAPRVLLLLSVMAAAGCGTHVAPLILPPPPPVAMVPPPPGVAAPANTDEFAPITENEFRLAAANPLSTFSIDVDAASYGIVRAFLLDRERLPPADAVRTEELVNYFPYDYPGPTDGRPFAIHTEVSAAPWNPAHRLVRIGLQGQRIDARELPPANLVFLVDVSGSMNAPNKLPLVQRSLQMLVEQMRPEDRVAIVVYAGAAGLVLPSTPGTEKRAIARALGRLQAGGSTAGAQGIRLAYRVARENFMEGGNNRVILATDGDFNVGVTSHGELLRLIEEEREHGVFLTVLGFGMGNLKDSRMEMLADRGNGNYAYVDGPAEARKVLVEQMAGTLLAIAKDVKVQVEFNPARVRAYRLIGYENRLLAAEDFADDRKDAGELGAGHSVTAFYEVVPVGVQTPVAGVDSLRYQQPVALSPTAAQTEELMLVKLRYKEPEGEESRLIEQAVLDRALSLDAASREFRFAAAVAEWAMLLRGSRHRGDASYARVIRMAREAKGEDRQGYREEFLRLVERSMALARERDP